MIISAIERLISKKMIFKDFHKWIEKQDSQIEQELLNCQELGKKEFKKIIRILKEKYFQEFGSRRNVFAFFNNYSIKEDKIKIIKSIRGKWTEVIDQFYPQIYDARHPPIPKTISELGKQTRLRVEYSLMPHCYNWQQCTIPYRDCIPGLPCLLQDSKIVLEETLKKVIADIYQLRNDFVHSARITPLNDNDSIGLLTTMVQKENQFLLN